MSRKQKKNPASDETLPEEAADSATGKQDDNAKELETDVDVEPAADDGEAAASGEEGLQNRFLRLQADFENFRKRTIRERAEISHRANENIISEMLGVLDNLEIALKAAEQHAADPAFVDGFRMVGRQLTSSLEKFGLKEADAEGAEFDPQVHEAISHMPSEDVEEGNVLLCYRKGYMLGDRLLRAAQVVVSSGKPATESEG